MKPKKRNRRGGRSINKGVSSLDMGGERDDAVLGSGAAEDWGASTHDVTRDPNFKILLFSHASPQSIPLLSISSL